MRFERDAADARVGDLRAQPILDIDKTEQAREQRKLVERSVAHRDGHVAGESLEEVGVGVAPQIAGEKEMAEQRRLLVLAAQHEERRRVHVGGAAHHVDPVVGGAADQLELASSAICRRAHVVDAPIAGRVCA